MAGYTDRAFRSVCAQWGADLCFTEMVSAEALSRGSRKTLRLLEREPNETVTGFQIFASDPRAAAAAVRLITRLAPRVIDLNCGCSVPKVLKTGCGAALMRQPALIREIVTAMRQETDVPVSVKLRTGWDAATPTFLECAALAVCAGASLVSLHPRFRTQGFTGAAQWPLIAELKRACAVPVFGSGDLFTAADCLGMLETTGCDGVMVARGALGNPFIFREVAALCAAGRPGPDGAPPGPSAAERLDTALRHLRLLALAKGEETACREMRKHYVAYTRGMRGGAALRQQVVQARTLSDYERLTAEFLGAGA
jgi:tRNA-dihydrouridine synthase B